MKTNLHRRGFTLVEVLVAVAIFLLFAVGIYSALTFVFKIVYQSRLNILETTILSEELEVVRNLAYDDVGISGGIPSGALLYTKTVTRNGIDFIIITTVRNIDDPFDGTLGGSPNDTAPADYKLVEMSAVCVACSQKTPVVLSTRVGPKNLEGSSKNGALFINVFNADGLPVSGVNVHVVNTAVTPSLVIDDVTDNQGYLRIIDAPTGTLSYTIQVSKSGYSSDYTLAASLSNPSPVKPPANVVSQAVTDISFAIDTVGSLAVHSLAPACSPIGNASFAINGEKLIGTPSVFKYNQNLSTNGSGDKAISNLEWDTYHLSTTNTSYDLAGSIPMTPLKLTPGMSQDVTMILVPHVTNNLLVKVKDAGTGLPLSNAEVRLTNGGYDRTIITGLGYTRQTDWSGGSGQGEYQETDKYLSDDNGLQINNPAGDVKLKKVGQFYLASGWLESSTFDLGTAVNFNNVIIDPTSQPSQAGPSSILLQLATSNTSTPSSWLFTGPDGTENSYYTTTSTLVYSGDSGKRYLRYRVFLTTQDPNYTPQLSEVSFTYTTNCTAPGQSFFNSLSSDTYTLEVKKEGYITNSGSVDVVGNTEIVVNLSSDT